MSKTVLWVDDSKFIRAVGRHLLAKLGMDMCEAGDGQEALDLLRRRDDIDLIMLDLNMPTMNGREFLNRLHADDLLPQPPVVLCTTEGDMPLIAEAMRAGAGEYIAKPMTDQELRRKLESVGLLDAGLARESVATV